MGELPSDDLTEVSRKLATVLMLTGNATRQGSYIEYLFKVIVGLDVRVSRRLIPELVRLELMSIVSGDELSGLDVDVNCMAICLLVPQRQLDFYSLSDVAYERSVSFKLKRHNGLAEWSYH